MQKYSLNWSSCQSRLSTILPVVGLCILFALAFFSHHAQAVVTLHSSLGDSDGDGAPNTADFDDDNDGIPDTTEIGANGEDIDSDSDGIPDRLDLDSDNDGILDWMESGATQSVDLSSLRKLGGRLAGEVGHNGLLDVLETFPDSGKIRFKLANTDSNYDYIPDYLDLDSDNDGWPDIREAGVANHFDVNKDGRLDFGVIGVGSDGIADYVQQVNDQACCDLNDDGVDDVMPVNTDGTDLPDFQDLDSDNDGIPDILELNGVDVDANGVVDGFSDVLGGPDGLDDGTMTFPYNPVDANGNGVFDHVDTADAGDQTTDLDRSTDPSELSPDALADFTSGEILTGLNASGCSIFAHSKASANYFWLLLLAAVTARFLVNGRLRNHK